MLISNTTDFDLQELFWDFLTLSGQQITFLRSNLAVHIYQESLKESHPFKKKI